MLELELTNDEELLVHLRGQYRVILKKDSVFGWNVELRDAEGFFLRRVYLKDFE